MPLPDLPVGASIPSTVLAAEIMWQAGAWEPSCYLPPGAQLSEDLKILPLSALQISGGGTRPLGGSGGCNSHLVLASRAVWSSGALPPTVHRASVDDLPHGALLGKNMEVCENGYLNIRICEYVDMGWAMLCV